MATKKTQIDTEVEIALADDALDRIDEYWFDQLKISSEDYVYIKHIDNHIIVGKAKIEFIE
jgi:hypothetical protein